MGNFQLKCDHFFKFYKIDWCDNKEGLSCLLYGSSLELRAAFDRLTCDKIFIVPDHVPKLCMTISTNLNFWQLLSWNILYLVVYDSR